MWQMPVALILASLFALGLFTVGWRMGRSSSTSTMTAAKELWGAASDQLGIRSSANTIAERLAESNLLLRSLIEKTKTEGAETRESISTLRATVETLDEYSGAIFQALNNGVVLHRGKLQEQVSGLQAAQRPAGSTEQRGPIRAHAAT